MPLTSHLKNTKGPISQFFRTQFPNSRRFLAPARKQIRKGYTIFPDCDVPWSTIATALDYRLRYYFAVTPYGKFVAYEGARDLTDALRDFFSGLDALTEEIDPVGRKLPQSQEDQLNRHCIVLALLEEVARAGLRPSSPLAKDKLGSADELLSLAKCHWTDDLRELSWEFYDKCHRLLELPHVLNPKFEGSPDVEGADADLIVDGTLIEIKTTKKREIKLDWLWQLLGYVLLDYSDRYRINGIGLYMARQGTLISWDLEEALRCLCSGESPRIKELRDQFKELVQGLRVGIWSSAE